jgi:hypothetical protein
MHQEKALLIWTHLIYILYLFDMGQNYTIVYATKKGKSH